MLEAGIRDHGVELPVALERALDDGAVARRGRQVGVGDVDAVHRPAVLGQPRHDRGSDPAGGPRDERGAHQLTKRNTCSATHTGFSPPSRSKLTVIVTCTPPWIGSTLSTRIVARTRDPAGTGAGKRTRFSP